MKPQATSSRPLRQLAFPQSAEIIFKLDYYIDGTGLTCFPALRLRIIVNDAGLRYLVRFFERFRTNVAKRPPEYSYDIRLGEPEIRSASRFLGDSMEIQLVRLTPRNRRAVFNKLNVSRGTARRGSAIPHLRKLAADAMACMQKESRHSLRRESAQARLRPIGKESKRGRGART